MAKELGQEIYEIAVETLIGDLPEPDKARVLAVVAYRKRAGLSGAGEHIRHMFEKTDRGGATLSREETCRLADTLAPGSFY